MTKTMNERFDERFNFSDIFEDPIRLCDSVQNDVKSFIQQEISLVKEEERKKCKQIFIDGVDWAEWGMGDKEAGELFDEKISNLITNK